VVDLRATIQQLRSDNRQLATALQQLAAAATAGSLSPGLVQALPPQLLQDALAAGKPSTAPPGGRQQRQQRPAAGSRRQASSSSGGRRATSGGLARSPAGFGSLGGSWTIGSGMPGSNALGGAAPPAFAAYLATTQPRQRRSTASPPRSAGASYGTAGGAWAAAGLGMTGLSLPAALPHSLVGAGGGSSSTGGEPRAPASSSARKQGPGRSRWGRVLPDALVNHNY
jgi:hypothetical protein